MTLASPSRPLRIAQVTGLISLKYGGFERFMVAFARACRDEATGCTVCGRPSPTVAGAEGRLGRRRGGICRDARHAT